MAVWRRRAIDSFPELQRKLNSRDDIEDVYSLWSELFAMWLGAHRIGDDALLDRIYSYADWCFRQRATNLSNSVAVCFYEHVLEHGSWDLVLPRLSDETIRDVWGLWEWRLNDASMTALRSLLTERGRPIPEQ